MKTSWENFNCAAPDLSPFTPPFQIEVELKQLATGHLAPKHDPDIEENNRKTMRFPHGPLMGGVLAELVKPEGCCLDVGAFIGDNTLEFLEFGLKVVAIEPFLDAVECAKLNAPNAIIIHAAAGDGGSVQLEYRCHSDNHGMRSVKPFPDGQGFPFRSLKIDELGLGKLDLLKIDAEGSEIRILSGAIETISKCRPVLFVEANSFFIGEQGQADLKSIIESMRYKVTPTCSEKVFDWIGVPI